MMRRCRLPLVLPEEITCLGHAIRHVRISKIHCKRKTAPIPNGTLFVSQLLWFEVNDSVDNDGSVVVKKM